jgi:polysaccharide deacetylase 2 family uncharacterized protein YibQ
MIKHIFLFLLSIIVILLSGHILPGYLNWSPDDLLPLPSTAISSSAENSISSGTSALSIEEKLAHALQPLKQKKRKNFQEWILGKEFSLVWQYSEAQLLLEKENCIIFPANYVKSSLEFSYNCLPGDTSVIRIKRGENYNDSTSTIAFIFSADSFSIDVLQGIKDMGFPYTLAIDPQKNTRTLLPDIERLNVKELLLRFPLESDHGRATKNTLLIDTPAEKIQKKLYEAKQQYPMAIGVINEKGKRALENTIFLEKFLAELKKQNLFFVENINSKHSQVSNICRQQEVICNRVQEQKNTETNRYLQSRIATARRRGAEIIYLNLSLENIKASQQVYQQAKNNGIQIVPLSSLTAQLP